MSKEQETLELLKRILEISWPVQPMSDSRGYYFTVSADDRDLILGATDQAIALLESQMSKNQEVIELYERAKAFQLGTNFVPTYRTGWIDGRDSVLGLFKQAIAVLSKPKCELCGGSGKVKANRKVKMNNTKVKVRFLNIKYFLEQAKEHDFIELKHGYIDRAAVEIENLCKALTSLESQPEPTESRFPLLGNKGNIGSIPWWVAEQAYMTYANRYGDEQSLRRLAERGGFGIEEMDEYYPKWRAKCDIIDRQAAEYKQLQIRLEESRKLSKGHKDRELANAKRCNDYYEHIEQLEATITSRALNYRKGKIKEQAEEIKQLGGKKEEYSLLLKDMHAQAHKHISKIKELEAKIDLASLELAHIKGEKTWTEIGIEQALKGKSK